ncbi:MAG: MBL fold metallo-hydrolase [Acholeplasmatales bacterium]|nr:MBL fold metallo-hydrolase [Acholeplasmatales bacterium]
MKYKRLIFMPIIMVSLLTACGVESNGTNNTSTKASSSISAESSSEEKLDLGSALDKLQSLDKITIYETTTATKDENTIVANRTTNVDLNKSYYYANYSCGDYSGTMQYDGYSFFYRTDNKSYKATYSDTGDVLRSTGLSKVFDLESSFKEKDNGYRLNITDTSVLGKMDAMFANAATDLGVDYSYNAAFVNIYAYANGEYMKFIIDETLAYSSYYSSLKREVTFAYTDFSYVDYDGTSGDKYLVDTDTTLTTYVQEMVYQYGDSIYIKSGDFDMLIDAGQNADGPNVDTMLSTYCTDHELDMLIATHGHGDHIGGFGNGALNSIENVKLIVDYGYTDNDPYYETIRTAYGADWYSAYDSVNNANGAFKTYKFSDDLSVEILDTGQYHEPGIPLNDTFNDENAYSVVCKLTFKEHTYLYTGDISQGYESALRNEDIENITVYKVAHHGASSNSSNSYSFLNYINPEYCVVSAAIIDQNDLSQQYHPTRAVVNRILGLEKISANNNLYYNGTMGTIKMVDDGTNDITVTGLGATRGYYYNGEKVTGEDNLKFTETVLYKYYY